MSRNRPSSALRGGGDSGAPRRSNALRTKQSNAQASGGSGSGVTGKQIPMTAGPSMQNIVAGFYNNLPAPMRDALPFGTGGGGGGGDDEDGPQG